MEDKQVENNWSISHLWNELITKEIQLGPRDYIRASEIGKPFLDRYLLMKGVPFTNPFDSRILRVFDTGKIFEVEVVERIFRLLGIMIDSQGEIKIQYPNLLPVIGHHDPRVGGKINREQAENALSNPDVSDWMKLRASELLNKLEQAYPNGLKVITSEIKSVNSQAFWAHKNIDPTTGFFKGYDHHKLQLWTYLGEGEEGRIFYISKDDLTLLESPIFKSDDNLRKLWMDDVTKMTEIWNSGKEPDHEDYIVFNEYRNMYEFNWRIKRSNYFTYITGFKTVDAWEKSLLSELKEKNSKACPRCQKVFSLLTLNKNDGYCTRCANAIKQEKGGVNNGQ